MNLNPSFDNSSNQNTNSKVRLLKIRNGIIFKYLNKDDDIMQGYDIKE